MYVREFLANKTLIMPQPPYSPDLAPADFFSIHFFVVVDV